MTLIPNLLISERRKGNARWKCPFLFALYKLYLIWIYVLQNSLRNVFVQIRGHQKGSTVSKNKTLLTKKLSALRKVLALPRFQVPWIEAQKTQVPYSSRNFPGNSQQVTSLACASVLSSKTDRITNSTVKLFRNMYIKCYIKISYYYSSLPYWHIWKVNTALS